MFALKDKYIDIFTDFGFKKLFGEEANKDILIDFLNTLLEGEQPTIVDLTFIKNEHLGDQALDRKAIFDLYCENEKGEKFIVELQKSKQNFFKDRSVYYSTFPIREQAERGNWNYKLQAVYTIGILDFVFEEDKQDPDKYFYKIKLSDIETNKVFYDKLTFIYLEMPKFNKSEDELSNHFERWMYVLKNLSRLQAYPEKLQEKIFQKFFAQAELAQMPADMRQSYEDSLKYYRDLNNVIDTAFDDGIKVGHEAGLQEGVKLGHETGLQEGVKLGHETGLQEGREAGLKEGELRKALDTAKNMLLLGIDIQSIAKCTGLRVEQIETLK